MTTPAELVAKRVAVQAVQSLADSEPSADTIEAQELLKGTPQESLFCVSAQELEAVIEVAISNAIYDGVLAEGAERDKLFSAVQELGVAGHVNRAVDRDLVECQLTIDPVALMAGGPRVVDEKLVELRQKLVALHSRQFSHPPTRTSLGGQEASPDAAR